MHVIIHPNPSSMFEHTIQIVSGIGSGAYHQTATATKQADGTWAATFETLPEIPCWFALEGESRSDGPLNFRRVFETTPSAVVTLHTIDGVAGVAHNAPRPFHDVPAESRRALMEAVYGPELLVTEPPIFNSYEMPHGTSILNGQVYFTVRAPHALAMSLLLTSTPESNTSQIPRIPIDLTTDLRYWFCAVPRAQAPHGAYYRFAYQDGRELLQTQFGEALDPASRWVLQPLHGGRLVSDLTDSLNSWSRVTDPDVLQQSFAGSSWRTPCWESLLIYELHVRRFTGRNAVASDFDQVAAELNGGYLARLPVTALEFLPLHEFPGDQGWGYNPSLHFAIASTYGGPGAFARLVRACHDNGRAVVVDLVLNHLIQSPLQELACSVYVSGKTVWGDMVHYAHPAAVEFFRQALLYLWTTFHLDGFRFDCTEAIMNGHRDNKDILAAGADGKLCVGKGKGLGISLRAENRPFAKQQTSWANLGPPLLAKMCLKTEGMTDAKTRCAVPASGRCELQALGEAAYNRDGEDQAREIHNSLHALNEPFWACR